MLSAGLQARIPLSFKDYLNQPCIMAAISEQPVGLWQPTEQRSCADVIAGLPSGDEQVNRPSPAVADGMQLRVHAAFGSAPSRQLASQSPAGPRIRRRQPPLLTAMPVAVWWTLRYVASIITVFCSPYSAARHACHRPWVCHVTSERTVPAVPSARRSVRKGRSCYRSVFRSVTPATRRKSMHPDPSGEMARSTYVAIFPTW